jgi:hypothetical protein
LTGLENSLLCREVLGEHRRALRGQTIGTSTFIGLKSGNQSAGLKSSEHLIERAGRQVDTRELLNVFDDGVTMFIATREAREYEDGGTGVSPESFN